jgi:hypothetical protein
MYLNLAWFLCIDNALGQSLFSKPLDVLWLSDEFMHVFTSFALAERNVSESQNKNNKKFRLNSSIAFCDILDCLNLWGV